jgi:hypothetical protein
MRINYIFYDLIGLDTISPKTFNFHTFTAFDGASAAIKISEASSPPLKFFRATSANNSGS